MTSPPQWSFAGPSRSPSEPTLADALRSILTWIGLIRPPCRTLRQLAAEERLVEKLAEEIDAEDETPTRPATKRRPRA